MNDRSLFVAGIAASAGGIEAMLELFAAVRPCGRIAWVVAQHMAHDDHRDLVIRLLARSVPLPVVAATDGLVLQPGTIHILPASSDGRVAGGRIRLAPPAPGAVSTPAANVLFESLAAQCGRRALGIVLSGTGRDGTAGCQAIRAAGGWTAAQDPASCGHAGMPQSAIDAGAVKAVLPLALLAEATLRQAGAPAAATTPRPQAPTPSHPAHPAAAPVMSTRHEPSAGDAGHATPLARLIELIRASTGVDFASYKEETLLRRAERRMRALGLANLDDYASYTAIRPDEQRRLQQTFLVSVSSFFRDRPAFVELRRRLATYLGNIVPDAPVRVWVPGCAAGEEAWSLAITLSDMLGKEAARARVQVRAQDLNPVAIAAAEARTYGEAALKEVSEELREHYLEALPGGEWRVGAGLAELVRFEATNVLGREIDGMFDLVSCRNLLIYLKVGAQEELVRQFHRHLRPGGLLFLGDAETLTPAGDVLFASLDHYHRVYQRRG